MSLDSTEVDRARLLIRRFNPCRRVGRLEASIGGILRASLPGAQLGERVVIGRNQGEAEVFGFKDDRVILITTGGQQTLALGMEIRSTGSVQRVPWSWQLLGMVLNAHGKRLDGGDLPVPITYRPLHGSAPNPMHRLPIDRVLVTGIRAIDGLFTLGRGQRIGLFAGPGVGKSMLLGQLARQAEADCTVVCLVGERGREVREFLERSLGDDGRRRSIVVCSTSDAPAGERARALPTATAIAEGFREQGKSVLLLVDSLTRHVRALRELAVAAGEAPGRRGYPPSVFDRLAGVIERTGNDQHGSITAIYTVLAEGDPEDDPVSQEVRGLLDGHVMLSPALARLGCFPAIDPSHSLSRLMDSLVDQKHRNAARDFKSVWSAFEDRRDLIAAGAYQAGSEPHTDRAIVCRPNQLKYLCQDSDVRAPFEETLQHLQRLSQDSFNGRSKEG